MSEAAIKVENLVKTFGGQRTLFGGRAHEVRAVRNISLELKQGETLAIVGESGSGKSTLARMLVGLEKPTSGTMVIDGQPWDELAKQGTRAFGRAIQYVFQDPVASLNPRKTVGNILDVPLRLLRGLDAEGRKRRARELLDAVQMPADTLQRFPHEFSGGQAQRIAIARALAADARIVVLDEPVSALDVSVQAQVRCSSTSSNRRSGSPICSSATISRSSNRFPTGLQSCIWGKWWRAAPRRGCSPTRATTIRVPSLPVRRAWGREKPLARNDRRD